MKTINLPLISDVILTIAAAFLLFFTAMRYYVKSAYIALPFAIAAAILFGALAFLIISGKQKKRRLVYADAKEREKLKTHLSLLNKGQACRLVLPCLGEGARVEKYRICANERVYYPMFSFNRLTESDVAAVIKRRCVKQKVILCNDFTPEAELLASKFNIGLISADELFDKLKKQDLLPEKYLGGDIARAGILKRIKSRFNRRLTAPLLFSGFALILLSYFTFFTIYYIAAGGILLVLAIISLFIS